MVVAAATVVTVTKAAPAVARACVMENHTAAVAADVLGSCASCLHRCCRSCSGLHLEKDVVCSVLLF